MARSYANLVTKLSLTLAVATGFASSAFAARISFATFNIKFYGTGGTMQGTSEDELRDPDLRRFLDTKLSDVDVIAFEEIVDVERFVTKVIGDRYRCQSYEHNHRLHQHVVVCTRGWLGFRKVKNDDNFTIEEVALTTGYRPAVWGVITDSKGKGLVQIAAVHLKAMPDGTDKRIEQSEIIVQALKSSGERIPTLITGDFNTYGDDAEILDGIFARKGLGLRQIPIAEDYTYRTPRYRSKFDRFWVTGGVRVTRTPIVWRVCNEGYQASESDQFNAADPYANLQYYNDRISDHCPVKVELDL